MEHIKTFEMITDKKGFRNLNLKDEQIISDFVDKFVDNLDIPSKISNLTLKEFEDKNLIYDEILNKFLTGDRYSEGNIYYEVDWYVGRNSVIGYHDTPSLRNTLQKVLDKKFISSGISSMMDKRLISLLEKDPLHYKRFYIIYGDHMTPKVKKSCEYMLSGEKYNL